MDMGSKFQRKGAEMEKTLSQQVRRCVRVGGERSSPSDEWKLREGA